MVMFDARAELEIAEADYPPFVFTDLDGEEHQLPHPMLMATDDLRRFEGVIRSTQVVVRADASEAEKIQAAGEAFDAYGDLIDAITDLFPGAGEAIRAMPHGVGQKLISAWQDTVPDEGKEPSPPSTTNRAGRRSKQTSRSAGSTSTGSRSAKSRPVSGSSSKTRRAS